ncbi:MAG TPA: nucleoside-diphosphate sugar epimerase/dehydratase [Clostridia bacterium]
MKALVNRIIFILGDLIIINFSIYAALLLKFDRYVPPYDKNTIIYSLAAVSLVSIFVFYMLGLYSRLWMYAGVDDLLRLFFATSAASITGFLLSFLIRISFPPSVHVISWLITFILIVGARLSYRIMRYIDRLGKFISHKKRAMIIGAGDAGSFLIKEIKSKKNSIYNPIVVIDDDDIKHGMKINGVPIIGGRDKIIETAALMNIDEIILAIPSNSKSRIKSILNLCKRTRCKIKILPSIYGIVNGKVSIQEIREVNVEDLLGRDKITMDIEEAAGYLKGETVLVTGGGGSIGSELCRQIAEFAPKMLLIFDIYENGAYELLNELSNIYEDKLNAKVIIGSIRDKKRLEEIFEEYAPTIVFHAAAHKHVPLMEDNPQEALKNNVFGTLNVAECANKYNSKKFILISTDKAVNPTSIMGATKRAAEMVMQYMNQQSSTVYAAVRFGNVLGSSGSVIPLFKKQIENGGPVTITHPDITRYFMTIPEASSLVIQAGSMAAGGEIFVLDMGEPVKIVDLAKSLITLSGLEPDIDISLEFTGLRPGEKLYEELIIAEDGVNITKNNKIFIEKTYNTDFDVLMEAINSYKDKECLNKDDVISFIKNTVPSYQGLS